MRKCRVWVKTALGALAVVAGGASLAGAEEVSLSNLLLQKTYLKTNNDGFTFQTESNVAITGDPLWNDLFTPTSITCPGRSGSTCTARIKVSAIFEQGGSGASVQCRVRHSVALLGKPVLALPGDVYFPDLNESFIFRQNGTFSWVARGLPVGSTTFRVECRVSDDFYTVMQRTLKIDIYKP